MEETELLTVSEEDGDAKGNVGKLIRFEKLLLAGICATGGT